jgi:hypothetical protein
METLREEPDHRGGVAASSGAILEGLRQSQAHTDILGQFIRREATRQALTHTTAATAAEPAIYQGVEL